MSGAVVLDVACSRVEIDPRFGTPRRVLRGKANRKGDHESRYDTRTLFADVFRDADGVGVTALGPPATPDYRRPGAIRAVSLPGGETLDFAWPVHGYLRFPERVRLDGLAGEDGVLLDFGGRQAAVPVQPNLSGLFAGRRVLLTVSKDNRLEWIADWARFHQVHHGVDAVVLYDNNSSTYAPGDVASVLAAVPGIAVVAVVPWPTPYGTHEYRQGWPASRLDALHAQPIALEHARRRLLARAALVFQVDVDELVVPWSSRRIDDVFDDPSVAWAAIRAQEAVLGVPSEGGRSMSERTARQPVDVPAVPRARDCCSVTGPSPGTGTKHHSKYLVVPERCSDDAVWWIHWVHGAPKVEVDPNVFRIAHQLPLSTGWEGREMRRTRRSSARPDAPDNALLRSRLEAAFDGWEPHVAPWTPAASGDPDLLRAEAQRLAAAGEAGAALGVLQEAIRRDPWHPAQAELRRELLAMLVADGGAR